MRMHDLRISSSEVSKRHPFEAIGRQRRLGADCWRNRESGPRLSIVIMADRYDGIDLMFGSDWWSCRGVCS